MQGQLVIARSDGTSPETCGKEGEYPWASWGPDGAQVACLEPKGIAFVDLASRKVVRRLDRKGIFQQLSWSPDGKWLTGVANVGEVWTIVRMDVATGDLIPVHEYQNCTPHWFPDSRRPPVSVEADGDVGASVERLYADPFGFRVIRASLDPRSFSPLGMRYT